MADTLASLASILGEAVDPETASKLLEDAGGSVEAAVARYFDQQSSQAGVEEAAASPLSLLRGLIGSEGTEAQVAALLELGGGDTQRAADIFFDSGLPATGAGAGAPANARKPRTRARTSRAVAQPPRRPPRVQLAVAQGGLGPARAEGSERRQRGRRHRQRPSAQEPTENPGAADADAAPSESSTDGSSTDSGAVTDEGSGEAPDSASEDESAEEGPSAPPQAVSAAPEANGVEEDFWEPSDDMIAEYEAAQTGEAPRQRQRKRRRSAEAARLHFQAVARMADMVVVPSSDDEDPRAAQASRPRDHPLGRASGAEGTAEESGQDEPGSSAPADDGLLTGAIPPITYLVQEVGILNMKMLKESKRPTAALKQPLPFARFRNKDGKLFGRSDAADLPAHDLMLSTLKFPILLGTLKLDLGKMREPTGEEFRSRSQRIGFRAMKVGVKGTRGRKVKEAKLVGQFAYSLKEVCSSAVMDVSHQTVAKGPFSKLCSLGGPDHPLAGLFGALACLKGYDMVKLASSASAVEPEAEGEQPRVQLRLKVSLTQKALTLDGPFQGGAQRYEGVKSKGLLSGDSWSEGLIGYQICNCGEMMHLLFHHLLLHGEGFGLGPDCDGLCNLMDDNALVAAETPRDRSPASTSEDAVQTAEADEDAAGPSSVARSLPITGPSQPGAGAAGESKAADLQQDESGPSAVQEAGMVTRKRNRPSEAAEHVTARRGSKRLRQEVAALITSAASLGRPLSRSGSLSGGPGSSHGGSSSNLGGMTRSAQAAAEARILAALDADSGISYVMKAGRLDPTFPPADQPSELKTTAKGWQLQGLNWMLEREQTGDPLFQGNLLLHPCWLQFQTADGQLIYTHRMQPYYVSANFYAAPSGGTCGGFLADAMGLGKTLQMIMLVLKHPSPPGWAVEDFSEAEGVTWTDGEKPKLSLKTTLVVVPQNLQSQWLEELRQHLHPGVLKWCTYSTKKSLWAASNVWPRPSKNSVTELWGITDERKDVPLHECDIAVVTYEELLDELRRNKRPPLMQWGFWRLCLDEAQLVSRTNTQAAGAVSDIYRRHAWVVTGTPITSKLEEIQGLFAFLDLEPFYHSRTWSALLDRERNGAGRHAVQPLFSLLRSVMLRRRKEDVGPDLELPPCAHLDWWLDLSKVERAVYDTKRREMEGALDQYVRSRNAAENNVRRHVNRCKKLLTDLRQACCDTQMVRAKEDETTSKRRSMQTIMTDLVIKAFQAYDVGLRSTLQCKIVLGSVRSEAVTETGQVLDEIRLALIRSAACPIAELLSERREDGNLTPPTSSPDDLRQGVASALQTLKQEVDESGAKVPWHVTWRRKKREAKEAAGLLSPTQQEPDPRLRWEREDQAEAEAQEDEAGADKPPAKAAAQENEDEAAGAKGADKKRTGQLENDKLNKRAAAKEKAARRLAQKKRKAERDAEFQAWQEKQAPAPQAEAEVQEEELARLANSRTRAWAKTLLDATALHADLLHTSSEVGELLPAVQEDGGAPGDPGTSADHSPQGASGRAENRIETDVAELKSLLGEDVTIAAAVGEEPRFSRRKRALEPGQEMKGKQYKMLLEQHAAKGRANNLLIAEMDKLKARKQAERPAKVALATATAQLANLWRAVRRNAKLQEEVAAKEKGKGVAQPGDDSVEQEDIYTCPICTDLAEKRTVTACGHFFCSECLRKALLVTSGCPLCRRPLGPEDLLDAFTADEAADAAEGRILISGEFSSKINKVVVEVIKMRAQRKGAKAVIFSTWSRLLKVLGAALQANGVPYASLAAAPDQRLSSLETFKNDPECSVLLCVLSTLGGAAGLTLTVADTVILMEPSMWPGLEAQAAGRVYRLGQSRETRVIRLLVRDTVEEGILREQQLKMNAKAADATMADVDPNAMLRILQGHAQDQGQMTTQEDPQQQRSGVIAADDN